ncbi:hypothetical protein CP02DC14_0732A, partial [Chlamydia psittaci 02DC14]
MVTFWLSVVAATLAGVGATPPP